MRGIIHWLRKQVFGECPYCKSTHVKAIRGWNKEECEACGANWYVDIF